MAEKQSAASDNGHPQPRRLPEKPSKVEKVKEEGRYLRGGIGETLENPETSHFEDQDLNLLKAHGIYQQYDRDVRAAKKDREYTLMIRARIPAGILSAEQYLQLDALAKEYGQERMRLTTRQSIQYHGVIKGDIKKLIRGMNERLVSTLAACGDVMRNVMCCPIINDDPARAAIQKTSERIALELAPKSGAYHDIWLNGEKLDHDDPLLKDPPRNGREPDEFEVEPLYGKLYLPRKFKMGIAMQDDNCIDVYTQDCGLIAIVDDDTRALKGYNLLVGGGLGMTHRKADTFARLATLIGSIAPDQAVDAVRTVIEIFRDFGNREDRRHARLKYTIEEFGVDWFIEEFNRRAPFSLQPPVEQRPLEHQNHLGWIDQGDGQWTYGLYVENGRLRDADGVNKLTGVREVVRELQADVRITAEQNLLFTHVPAGRKDRLIEILREHNVPLNEEISAVRRNAMACPALPTCGLALADAERVLPDILTELEGVLHELGLGEDEIGVRMTGCPNGCARPYTADIAFVGRGPGAYDVYCGGRLAGDRLVDLLAEKVSTEEIIPTLRPLLEQYVQERETGEGFGDWWQRALGRRNEPRTLLRGSKDIYNPTLRGEPMG